jgi:hypothetical protein
VRSGPGDAEALVDHGLCSLVQAPGGRNADDEGASPRWNEPFTEPFTQPWGGGFKRSMPALLRSLIPEATAADRTFLYAVYNFDSIQNPQAKQVPFARMRKGVRGVLSLLETSPPRLIVPMERRSFYLLKDGLGQSGYDLGVNHEFPISIPIYNNPRRFHRKIFGFKINGRGPLKGSVAVGLPQHPAKILRVDYATACAKAVRDLFEQLAGADK